jgi:hypothetical protein
MFIERRTVSFLMNPAGEVALLAKKTGLSEARRQVGIWLAY